MKADRDEIVEQYTHHVPPPGCGHCVQLVLQRQEAVQPRTQSPRPNASR